MIRFILNEKEIATSQLPGMVLLDFIRYQRHLMGTKAGCREGDCGACTVLVGELKKGSLHYQSMTSCLVPLGNVQGKHIVTIEGLNFKEGLNPVQQAMAEEGATQCGFCTPGVIVSLAGFCLGNKDATTENAIAAVDGNICRCTGYKSIGRAAGRVARLMNDRNGEEPAQFVTRKKIFPDYFAGIKAKLLSWTNGQSAIHPAGNTLPAATTGYLRQAVAGGTDLYVQKHDELVHTEMRFLFDDAALKGVRREGNHCLIGASATATDLLESPVIQQAFPAFHRYARLIASTPIRNMATIAGNIINASPIGDFSIFFLALDARLLLSDGRMRRELPLRKLYKGYKQLDKKPDEYIEQIKFELPAKNSFFNFEKVSKRTHLDIASVNSAIYVELKNDRIERAALSAGGVAPVPLYLQKTAAFLIGKTISAELVSEAIKVMRNEISPISDARGTREYKTLLLEQLIKVHFRRCL